MRINILTQPLFCNYGGILQNYALQKVLRRMGHEPLTINMPTPMPGKTVMWKDLTHAAINLVQKIRGDYDNPFLRPSVLRKKEHELSAPQREFVRKYISKIDVAPPFTQKVCEDNKAEAWVVGSDQIWRPWCSPYITNAFLDFVGGDKVKKIAYAASFGTDQWEISPELTSKIKPMAAAFNAISVRESSGVGLCERYLGIKAVHVLDPTLLLEADDYLSLTSESDYPSGDYIATYILDLNADKRKTIAAESRAKNMPIKKVGRMYKGGFDTIESWLATIAHAKYVITDSFHGTVFSLIFNRPVKILTNNVRGNARLNSLLSTLGLQPDNEGFVVVHTTIAPSFGFLRDISLTFLEDALC